MEESGLRPPWTVSRMEDGWPWMVGVERGCLSSVPTGAEVGVAF